MHQDAAKKPACQKDHLSFVEQKKHQRTNHNQEAINGQPHSMYAPCSLMQLPCAGPTLVVYQLHELGRQQRKCRGASPVDAYNRHREV